MLPQLFLHKIKEGVACESSQTLQLDECKSVAITSRFVIVVTTVYAKTTEST